MPYRGTVGGTKTFGNNGPTSKEQKRPCGRCGVGISGATVARNGHNVCKSCRDADPDYMKGMKW
jgi:hypothetical protein